MPFHFRAPAVRSALRIFAFAALLAAAAPARADVILYDDSVTSGFGDWSWGATTRNFSSTSVVHSGTYGIATTFADGWSGMQLGNASGVDVSAYDTLRFFIHGGASGGQNIVVYVGNSSTSVTQAVTPAAGGWTQVDVPITDLGSPRSVTFVYWFNNTPGAQPTFHLDDVRFLASGNPPPPPPPTGSGPALAVDAAADVRAIDPDIYGMNFADEALADELAMPVRRWGGNATTRYNWQLDTSNRAFDWYFENIPNDNPNPSALPDGSETDLFVEQDRRTGTRTMLTVPLIGWTPKSRDYACGFSVAKYGAQQSVDPWRPDCGNGKTPGGANITGNDPTDTSIAITPAFVSSWIDHLTGKYGDASEGGVAYYSLDNEWTLWNSTHRDVHPLPTSYDEMRDRTYAYAPAVKAADPTAKTFGPSPWGWTAYFWSALDEAAGGAWWNNPPDRNAHGGKAFLPWYLEQMKAYADSHGGSRILDYLDIHYYEQASGVSLSSAGGTATQALRLRSTRSLWDPSYTAESWIGEPVRLIPRMREWIDAEYPGTKLAITEYNWGGLEHINGALAQADVLGIFGREGVDLATLWAPPTSGQPGAYAFRIYRNYDGAGSRFGDTHVRATSADQSKLSIYASIRESDGALTIVVINKHTTPLTTTISLGNYAPAAEARHYVYSAANLAAIVRGSDLAVESNAIDAEFAASSINLIVVPGEGSTPSGACAETPRTDCVSPAAEASRLKIRWDTGAGKGGFLWKWKGAAPATNDDFGSPTEGDSFDVCLYANGAPKSETHLPSILDCSDPTCWRESSSGFSYASRSLVPDGIAKASWKSGDAPKLSVKASGPNMPVPGLPLTAPVVVQLVRTGGTACWQATFTQSRTSSAVAFTAVSD